MLVERGYPKVRKSNQRIFRVRAIDAADEIRRVLGIDVFSDLFVAEWGRLRDEVRRVRPFDLSDPKDLQLR